MRRYNKVVYHDIVEGTTERFTGAEHNELLGSAEVFVLQWRATSVGGTGPKLTLTLYGSDNGKDWIPRETLLNQAVLTAGQLNTGAVDSTTSTRTMAGGRIGVALVGTNPVAEVELIVCGRDA
ncbi:MAG: hypothetical protein HY909_05990 [Deltaproteobacteria bacterium]|nr:hypothetical protein [Deltaproteobacteria bacterium]